MDNDRRVTWAVAVLALDWRLAWQLAKATVEELKFRRSLRHVEGTVAIWSLMLGDEEDDEE